jgi:hypothetical protein
MSGDPLAAFASRLEAAEPEEAMRKACRAILAATGQCEPPIALAPVWRKVGAQVRRDETIGDGSTQAIGDGFVVRVPASVKRTGGRGHGGNWRRSRFTVAHEIGHVLLLRTLPAGSRADLACEEHHAQVERLCNVAAAELLMPAARFAQDLKAAGVTPEGLACIYDNYLVSWSTLAVRIAEVSDASTSLWRTGTRPGERDVLRVTSSSGGRGWLPDDLSERFLSQPVVRLALRDGLAACGRLRSAHATSDVFSPALAARISRRDAPQRPLPQWGDTAIPDEHLADELVLLARLPIGATATFEDLRRSVPIDADDMPIALAR